MMELETVMEMERRDNKEKTKEKVTDNATKHKEDFSSFQNPLPVQ